jgi:hypothetical protein
MPLSSYGCDGKQARSITRTPEKHKRHASMLAARLASITIACGTRRRHGQSQSRRYLFKLTGEALLDFFKTPVMRLL